MTETLSQQVKQITDALWDDSLRLDGGESADERSAYHVGLVAMRQSMLDLIRVNRLDAMPELLAACKSGLELLLAALHDLERNPDDYGVVAMIQDALARAASEEVARCSG